MAMVVAVAVAMPMPPEWLWFQHQPGRKGLSVDLGMVRIEAVLLGIVEGVGDPHAPRPGNRGQRPADAELFLDQGRLRFRSPTNEAVADHDGGAAPVAAAAAATMAVMMAAMAFGGGGGGGGCRV
eukprot:CAMPEP_0172387668 /NCGR_PEP_ID=MMETSP1061-20121228/4948_1 /TAXON_ID=37318 /ORGANISM="Pseudo-nitzschia pungens, Strain cf. pungens" /LENGTH=124 /DNA_ID=CAMNT_0013117373 /DNA_START=99 /DNA_END=470 /DNA_ORIENTATION=+